MENFRDWTGLAGADGTSVDVSDGAWASDRIDGNDFPSLLHGLASHVCGLQVADGLFEDSESNAIDRPEFLLGIQQMTGFGRNDQITAAAFDKQALGVEEQDFVLVVLIGQFSCALPHRLVSQFGPACFARTPMRERGGFGRPGDGIIGPWTSRSDQLNIGRVAGRGEGSNDAFGFGESGFGEGAEHAQQREPVRRPPSEPLSVALQPFDVIPLKGDGAISHLSCREGPRSLKDCGRLGDLGSRVDLALIPDRRVHGCGDGLPQRSSAGVYLVSVGPV